MTLSRCVTVVRSPSVASSRATVRMRPRRVDAPRTSTSAPRRLSSRRGQVDQIGLAERHVAEQVGQRRRPEQADRPDRAAVGQDGQALEDVVDLPQRHGQPQPAVGLDRRRGSRNSRPRRSRAARARAPDRLRPRGRRARAVLRPSGRPRSGSGRCAWSRLVSRLPCSVQGPETCYTSAAPVSPVTPDPARGHALERLLLVHEHAAAWLGRLRAASRTSRSRSARSPTGCRGSWRRSGPPWPIRARPRVSPAQRIGRCSTARACAGSMSAARATTIWPGGRRGRSCSPTAAACWRRSWPRRSWRRSWHSPSACRASCASSRRGTGRRIRGARWPVALW